MKEPDHFDQVAPVDGIQVQPDGSLAVAPVVRPIGAPEDGMYEQPSLPPQFTSGPSGDALAAAVHEKIEADRERLAEPAGNLDVQGAPHFLRILPDGEEVCGQDGKPWPCAGAQGLTEQAHRAQFGDPAGRVGADGSPALRTLGESLGAADVQPGTPSFEDVAAALGMSADQLARTVREQQDKLRHGLTRGA